MRFFEPPLGGTPRGYDFSLVLPAIAVVFAAVALLQFAHGLPGLTHGLYLFEKACPIYRLNA